MESIFQAGKELFVAYDEEVVVVLQEVLTTSGPKLKFISCPDARRAGETIKIASAFAVFGYFEIGKSVGLGQEDHVNG
jgi:hypothetical protein